jgi:hypothetical protein
MKNQNLARCFGCETGFNPIDMVMAVGKTGFRQSADFLTGLLESGMPAKPVAPAARGPSELASLSSVLSSMAETPPDGETAASRVRCLEKEVAELKSGMDRLRLVVGAILAQRGDSREIFAKTDG